MRIAIIGAGKMGVWFANFFRNEGHSVVIADRKKEKLIKLEKEAGFETADFVKAVENADRILICVSIDAFEEIVRKISRAVKKKQAVMDICSIKSHPVEMMHKYLPNRLVLGTHPVFGPGSTNIANKTFVLTPTNNEEEKFADAFKTWLESKKARVFIMSPKKHDQLMSVVLGLPHFIGLAACEALLEQPEYAETKDVAGTTYRMLFTLAEVTALEKPDLFSSLQFSLPNMGELERLFIKKAEEWLKIIKQKDPAAIANKMERIKAKLKEKTGNYEKSYEIMYRMLEASEKTN